MRDATRHLGAPAAHPDELAKAGIRQKPVEPDELPSPADRPVEPRNLEVLVIDDEPTVRGMLTAALTHFGFAVLQAGGCDEAVAVLRRHGSVDVVLLDVQMPEADGPCTLAALRQVKPGIRCCFMSGSTGTYSTRQLMDLGAASVFHKPFSSLADLARELWQIACA